MHIVRGKENLRCSLSQPQLVFSLNFSDNSSYRKKWNPTMASCFKCIQEMFNNILLLVLVAAMLLTPKCTTVVVKHFLNSSRLWDVSISIWGFSFGDFLLGISVRGFSYLEPAYLETAYMAMFKKACEFRDISKTAKIKKIQITCQHSIVFI